MGGRGRKTHAKKGYRIRMPSAITYAGHKTTYHSPQRHPRPSSDAFYLKTILCESIYIRKCKWYTVRILIYNSGSNYIIAIMLTAAILRIWTTVMITRVGEIRVSKFNARKRITRKMMIMIATKITIAIVRIILKKECSNSSDIHFQNITIIYKNASK